MNQEDFQKLCNICKKPHSETTKACRKCKDYHNNYSKKIKENRLCRQCCKPLCETDKGTCIECTDKLLQRRKTKKETRYAQGLCYVCSNKLEDIKYRLCKSCSISKRKSYNKTIRKQKDLVYNYYGGYKCNCCGESREIFLVIDHINNDGNIHRKEISKGKHSSSSRSHKLCSWIIRNNYPPMFQILCHNCNYAKSQGGCPHLKQDTEWLRNSLESGCNSY